MSDLGAGVTHIMLGVRDVATSAAFYEQKLGRAVRFRVDTFALIDAGPVMIGLSQDLGKARQPTAGATEIVFSVPAVKAAWRALKEKGVAFVHDPRQLTEKEWGATLADPDGHYLTIFGPPGE